MSEAMQDFITVSRYSRYRPADQRRENWPEMVKRVTDMHATFYAHLLPGDDSESKSGDAKELARLMDVARVALLEKKVLGSQRALQFGGQPILDKHARMYNCTSTYIDRSRSFQEVMWLLLAGSGVGVSVQRHHVDKLPDLRAVDAGQRVKFVIEDSVEGWSDSLGVLLDAYWDVPATKPWHGKTVVFDYSEIRPKGASISNMGPTAPGHAPLEQALERVRALMERCVPNKRLRPLDAFDVLMHASDAVVSGGIRRSAILTLFSPDDHEMRTAKTGNWFLTNPQRARSNNSALLLRHETTHAEFATLIESTRAFGEPGFVWSDDTELLVNPCCEIGMYGYDEKGRSGFQSCNLSEINMKTVADEKDFLQRCEAASILGTLQAGYTDFAYLGEVTESIVRREALIGVSMTGMMDNPDLAFDPQILERGAAVVVDTNRRMARLLNINPAARCTCVKPSGTASCILGTASGIHANHAKHFLRSVQVNKQEKPLAHLQKAWPEAVMESCWSANASDMVVTFPCETQPNARTKQDVDALELLELVRRVQRHWVLPGTTDGNVKKWLTHNVSNTVNVAAGQWDAVRDYIYRHRTEFCGVALLADSGDLDYRQAPFQRVLTPHELVDKYGDASVFASGLVVHAKDAFGDLYDACDALLGTGEKVDTRPLSVEVSDDSMSAAMAALQVRLRKLTWLAQARKFSHRYFHEDLHEMTYCLKHVSAWKKWVDLKRTYRKVDWSTFRESRDNTNPSSLAACAGGVCEVVHL
jgi:ribonucleoside-triphosphate reductase